MEGEAWQAAEVRQCRSAWVAFLLGGIGFWAWGGATSRPDVDLGGAGECRAVCGIAAAPTFRRMRCFWVSTAPHSSSSSPSVTFVF